MEEHKMINAEAARELSSKKIPDPYTMEEIESMIKDSASRGSKDLYLDSSQSNKVLKYDTMKDLKNNGYHIYVMGIELDGNKDLDYATMARISWT